MLPNARISRSKDKYFLEKIKHVIRTFHQLFQIMDKFNEFSTNLPRHIAKEKCEQITKFLWTPSWSKAETASSLVFRYHSTSFARVNCLQQPHNLVHVRSFLWVRIPTLLHDMCKRTWTATWDFWPQILPKTENTGVKLLAANHVTNIS